MESKSCVTRNFCDSSKRKHHSPLIRGVDQLLPLGKREALGLTSIEGSAVHGLSPTESHLQPALREQPEGFFGSVIAGRFAIEEQRHFAVGELLGPTRDLFDLSLSDAVRANRDRWNAEVVERDHVVVALDDDDPVGRDRFTVAGFFEAARLLAEEFLAAMKAFRNLVLHGRSLVATQLGADRVVLRLLLFEEWIATDPRQDVAILRKHGLGDVAA